MSLASRKSIDPGISGYGQETDRERDDRIFSTFVLQEAVKLVQRTSLDKKHRPKAEIM